MRFGYLIKLIVTYLLTCVMIIGMILIAIAVIAAAIIL